MPRLVLGSPDSRAELEAGKDVRRTVATTGPYGVHDVLRNGPHSTAHDLAPPHPLRPHLSTLAEEDEQRRMVLGAQLFGQHIPVRQRAEKVIVEGCARLHGLASSNLGLSIVAGTDETIDICDFLNVPTDSPNMPSL